VEIFRTYYAIYGLKENHYATTAKKFREFVAKNVFKEAYKRLFLNNFTKKTNNVLICILMVVKYTIVEVSIK
jgi:hypothetical protein